MSQNNQSSRTAVQQSRIQLSIAHAEWATAPAVLNAIRRRMDENPVFNYPFGGVNQSQVDFFDSVTAWYRRVYGANVQRGWLTALPGIVPSLSSLIKVHDGDILANSPNYSMLLSAPLKAGKRIFISPMTERDRDGVISYEPDFDDMAKLVTENKLRFLYLCNPHNPIGKVYTRPELEEFAGFAKRFNLTVISDEIHCELVYDKPHIPYVTVSEENSITLTSPGKVCNMPGIPVAAAVIPDSELHERVKKLGSSLGSVGALNLAGGTGAYSEDCDEWKLEVVNLLRSNRDYLDKALLEHFPLARVTHTEGTFLQWVDLSAYGLGDAQKELETRASVSLTGGQSFGGTLGHVRINFAAPRDVLQQALTRIRSVLRQ